MWCNKFLSKFCLRIVVIVTVLSFLYIGVVDAAPKPKTEKITRRRVISETPVAKSVIGTISYVDGKYIAIVYGKDNKTGIEKEIGFWLNQEVTYARIGSAAELNEGDTVEIEYEEIQQMVDLTKGDKTVERTTRVKKFEPKVVKLRSPAKGKLRSK